MAYSNSWVNSTVTSGSAPGISVTIAPNAGDVLIAWAVTDANDVLSAYTAGWTALAKLHSSADNADLFVLHKVADGTETSVNFQTNSGNSMIAGCVAISGRDTATPLDVAPVSIANSGSGTTADISITPVTDGCDLVFVECLDDGSSNTTFAFATQSGTTGSWTTRVDQHAAYYDVGCGTAEQVTAGALTARCTTSVAGGRLGWLFALRPASAPSGAALEGAATGSASAGGSLSTGIKLDGAATAGASAAGALTTGSAHALEGQATAGAAATGSLSTGVRLAAGAVAGASASGALTAGGIAPPTGLNDTSVTIGSITVEFNTSVGDDSYDIRFRSTATSPAVQTVDGMDWYLDRMSQRTRSVTGKYRYRYTGAGVRVYVLDSGIRATHNQFAGRVASGYNAVPGAPSYDEFGHGTEVASCAAGTVAGTAKGATIVPVKVYSVGDEYLAATSDDYAVWYVDGLDWIINNHPVHTRGVVVSSIPAPGKASASAVKAKWQALIDMGLPCFEALPNLNAEGLPEGIAYYPDQMVIVAGMREVDAWDSTSNYADYVDIIAPSYDLDGIAGYGSDSEGINGSGNSYATGFVAGIAALLLEENPHATVDRILETMLQQANIGALSSVPSGTPNVLAYSLATSTDWVTHTDVTEPYTIDGLEPKSEYEIQVRRTVGGQTSDWSSSLLTETPEVQLGGGAPASATASGALTTAIKVAGAAVVAATASGAISTSIRLAGAAASVTLAGGDLTIQIRLQGDALAAAVAAAGLTTAIQLAATAQAGAQASGDLTTGAGAAALAGNALASAIASGSLTTIIRLDGAALAGAIAQGVLTTGISLDGAAAVGAAAQGALSTEIRLAGAAIGSALASGDISGAAQLAGAAIGSALAAGDLTTAIRLAGAALAATNAAAGLTVGSSLQADAQMLAMASGGLLTAIRLAGASAAVVQSSGTLSVDIRLNASAFAKALAAGALSTRIELNGAAVASALATARLDAILGRLRGQIIVGAHRGLIVARQARGFLVGR